MFFRLIISLPFYFPFQFILIMRTKSTFRRDYFEVFSILYWERHCTASLPTCEIPATDMPLFRCNDVHATEGRGIMEPLGRAGLYGRPVLPLFDRPFANVTKRIPLSLRLPLERRRWKWRRLTDRDAMVAGFTNLSRWSLAIQVSGVRCPVRSSQQRTVSLQSGLKATRSDLLQLRSTLRATRPRRRWAIILIL